MKPMATLHDLIEEAKVRALWWGICVFGITYFLSHTSKSMWTNLPISILILCALRYISYEVELRWKVRPIAKQSYLSHLQKKQLPLDDPRLKTLPPMSTWKKKVDSPLVETAVKDFINKLLHDFVVDLWYSSITPDKEAPELIKALILDVIGEVSLRIRDINLADLLTRDIVELIGNHLELFRKNQSIIGVEVMRTLSSEERDEKLKHHMLASKELHPALISSECEYKTLQRIVGGILAVVLNQREVQSPLVRCFARELLTCLVMEPVMNLASPGYINELIELIYLNSTVDTNKGGNVNVEASAATVSTSSMEHYDINKLASSHHSDINVAHVEGKISASTAIDVFQEDLDHSLPPKPADWARVLDAATKRRTQVLAPENLEDMWAKGRNYKKKTAKLAKAVSAESTATVTSKVLDNYVDGGVTKELSTKVNVPAASDREKNIVQLQESIQDANTTDPMTCSKLVSKSLNAVQRVGANSPGLDGGKKPPKDTRYQLKRSSSTSDLKSQNYDNKTLATHSGEAVFAAAYKNQDFKAAAESISFEERPLDIPKLRCRVVGAYFEKTGSNSFAVYAIAVTDAENKSWFVRRRYRNFERLHRQLKDIPNYTLHLPPKRFLSSSIDDYFVHQRCILLDKYLKDLLSIANIAEQHEVWDFLSSSSKNYSFGKSTSVMKTLAVNVDDAMDDIVRQFKGVSDGLLRKVAGNPSSFPYTVSPPTSEKALSLTWNEDENSKHTLENNTVGVSRSLSDDEVNEDEGSVSNSGWHSDNELNSKGLPPRVLKHNDCVRSVGSQESEFLGKLEGVSLDHSYISKPPEISDRLGEPDAVPPEWSPPNVSVPILNLVDNIFQLKKRGWLRRQVFWISKQILQLMMEDAIDDWLLRQIHWLRRDDIVAQGIRWLQNVLWPNGVFFIKLESNQEKADADMERNQNMGSSSGRTRKGPKPVSFEEQLEATRRASEVKKLLLGGAPTTLVSLIGNKQYRRCTRDIYYFLQSSVCIKQLAYGILELVVISIFPELHDLILDVHQNA